MLTGGRLDARTVRRVSLFSGFYLPHVHRIVLRMVVASYGPADRRSGIGTVDVYRHDVLSTVARRHAPVAHGNDRVE